MSQQHFAGRKLRQRSTSEWKADAQARIYDKKLFQVSSGRSLCCHTVIAKLVILTSTMYFFQRTDWHLVRAGQVYGARWIIRADCGSSPLL